MTTTNKITPLSGRSQKALPDLDIGRAQRPKWEFLSNHAHVLVCLSYDPNMRLSEISARVGVTTRVVQKIIKDLEDEKVISIEKVGRRNRYAIDRKFPFRHELEKHCNIGQLLNLVAE